MATSHSQDACSLLICCHLRWAWATRAPRPNQPRAPQPAFINCGEPQSDELFDSSSAEKRSVGPPPPIPCSSRPRRSPARAPRGDAASQPPRKNQPQVPRSTSSSVRDHQADDVLVHDSTHKRLIWPPPHPPLGQAPRCRWPARWPRRTSNPWKGVVRTIGRPLSRR